MLATLIQWCDKKIISFQEQETNWNFTGATLYDCINTKYQFIKPFLDNKMSIFEGYEAFNIWPQTSSFLHLEYNKIAVRTFPHRQAAWT